MKTRIKFMWGKADTNSHIYPGFHTIHGPKFKHVRLEVHKPSTGHRFIFYFPSGAWWHFDVYFDRRGYFTFWGKLRKRGGTHV